MVIAILCERWLFTQLFFRATLNNVLILKLNLRVYSMVFASILISLCCIISLQSSDWKSNKRVAPSVIVTPPAEDFEKIRHRLEQKCDDAQSKLDTILQESNISKADRLDKLSHLYETVFIPLGAKLWDYTLQCPKYYPFTTFYTARDLLLQQADSDAFITRMDHAITSIEAFGKAYSIFERLPIEQQKKYRTKASILWEAGVEHSAPGKQLLWLQQYVEFSPDMGERISDKLRKKSPNEQLKQVELLLKIRFFEKKINGNSAPQGSGLWHLQVRATIIKLRAAIEEQQRKDQSFDGKVRDQAEEMVLKPFKDDKQNVIDQLFMTTYTPFVNMREVRWVRPIYEIVETWLSNNDKDTALHYAKSMIKLIITANSKKQLQKE
jgi:hypothetical protein